MSDNEWDRLPTQEELDRTAKLPIYDQDGNSREFGSLWNRQERTEIRNIIIFIRHFFCGSCLEYVKALSKELPPAGLYLRTPRTTLTIIGCGDYSLIPDYISRSGCKFDVYTDPTRAIYETFGMMCNLGLGEKKPEYIQKSFLDNLASSVWVTLSSPLASPGKKSQNGGEFIWVDGEIKWAKRMRNTRDHTEIEDLKSVLESQKESGDRDGEYAETNNEKSD